MGQADPKRLGRLLEQQERRTQLHRNRREPLGPHGDGAAQRPPIFAHETLYTRIASHLRELIVTRQLRPGERLPSEREFAQLLGVSRVPIREAMRVLSAQGLVEIRRGHGVYVTSQNIEATIDHLALVVLNQRDTFKELFAVRRLLEPPAAQWAAMHCDDGDVQQLRKIAADMESASTEPVNFEALADLDVQLHVLIAEAAQNRVLRTIMESIQGFHRQQLESSLRYKGRVGQTFRDHTRIVTAIVNGDVVEAGAAMIDHLTNSETATLRRIEGETIPSP